MDGSISKECKKDEIAPIEIIDYSIDEVNEYSIENMDRFDFLQHSDKTIRWINIDGKCTESVVEKLCKEYSIHPLVYQDISDNNQRAKVEDYGDYIYVVAKMIYFSSGDLVIEHISFILGKDYMISFGEVKGDVFEDVRKKIRSNGSQIRKQGADFLMYSLIDAIIDGYFDVLEDLEGKIELLEDEAMTDCEPDLLNSIREMRNTLLRINRSLLPIRDVLYLLTTKETKLILPATEPYMRDIANHITQAIETNETHREMVVGLMDLYYSNTSNKLNGIMKVLTIISTVFMPLTFIVGVYGMNFKYMPEIGYKWSYLIVWAVMLAVTGFMMYYFRKKKWF
jgi:magnesium transporter